MGRVRSDENCNRHEIETHVALELWLAVEGVDDDEVVAFHDNSSGVQNGESGGDRISAQSVHAGHVLLSLRTLLCCIDSILSDNAGNAVLQTASIVTVVEGDLLLKIVSLGLAIVSQSHGCE